MIRIIDLDIEGTITGDTKVTEIALVEMPAIEQNFIYFTKEQFVDTITDYPQYIIDNAREAKAWVDENGYGSCMTPVGKARLNQLSKGEPLSLLTLKRMKAYADRHKKDLQSSKSFDDGCGYLAWFSWGLDETGRVEKWLESKINKLETGMAEIGDRGGIKESPKAPKSDTPNKNPKGEGSAKGDASTTRGAEVSKRVEETLQNKSDEFNERYKDKLGYGVNLGMLKSVYQRGVGAYNVSHSPAVKSAEQWALARVNAFLYLVKNGRPENPKYDSDYDLLPTKHPKKKENMEYEPGTLPDYANYPVGDKTKCKDPARNGGVDCTNKDMLIEPVLFVKRQPGEDRSEYINRCTEYLIKNEGKQPDQAYAICNSTADEYSIGQKVSFDFDDTLNTPRGRGLALYELQSGSDVYIISARQNKEGMYPIADELGIPHSKVFATGSNRAKLQKIKDLKITKHYDNNEDVISQLGRVGIQFMCPCLDEFVAIIEPLVVTTYTPENAIFSESNLDVYGYRTKYFQICPGAQATFKELTSYPNDDDTIGMIRSAAVVADSIFKIEDDVLKASNATESQLSEATVLVDDFKDIINEIQKIQGKTYNVSYMDNHIRTIASYVKGGKQNFTMIGFIDGEPVFTTPEEAEMYGEKQHGCSGHHTHTDEDGNVVYMGCSVHPKEDYSFSVDEYSEEEKEVVKLLHFLKDNDYQQFEAVLGAMRGATEAEIKRRNHKNPTIYFKYERVLSGAPDRDFCTSIENRYFRRVEIDLLRDTNVEFGHERQPYSKWLYKGGPNCVHAWRRYLVQGDVVADQGMAEGKAGIPPKSQPNSGYYSPETKRKSEVAYIISQQNMSKQEFSVDDEKRMVYSPLMIPNILIPRIDEETNEKYFVKFTPSVIEKIQNLYMIEKRLDQTNYEHTDKKIESVVMVESWLVSGPSDKAYQLGFSREDLPDGTWMGGFKVLDTQEGNNIWNNYIKTGKVKGFSVEGNFLMNFSRLKKDEYLLDEIINIIKQITD